MRPATASSLAASAGSRLAGAVTMADRKAPEFACMGDVESGGPVLGEGKRITVGALQCVSREGITCIDDDGHGFRLGTGSYLLTVATAAAWQDSAGKSADRNQAFAFTVVEPGTARGEDALAARQGLGAGTLAILLSPLVEPASTQQVAMLTSAGIEVIVVDTLPAELAAGDDHGRSPEEQLAWRLRMLQRRLERDRMASLGIPVVSWSGPHSIDKVLRDLARRSSTPRLVRR